MSLTTITFLKVKRHLTIQKTHSGIDLSIKQGEQMDAVWDPSFPHSTVVKRAKRNEEALIGVMNISKSKQTRW